ISEKMKAQIKALDTASSNCQDGISLVQTAEGALTEVHDMLNRMVELAGKSANGTMETPKTGTPGLGNGGTDRDALQEEMDALCKEIDRIADSTNFNGIKLLDGTLGGGATGGNNTVNTAAPSATLDATDAAGLGAAPTFAFDAAATDEMKAAFNEALGEGAAITFEGDLTQGANNAGFDAGDTLTISGLPQGYTYSVKAADGTTDISDTNGTLVLTHGTTGATDVNMTQDIAITIVDADNKTVGTLTVGAVDGSLQSGETTVTMAAGDPAQAPATAAAGDAGDVEAAGPTFTPDDAKLAAFDIKSIDLSGYEGEIEAGTEVKVEYLADGTDGTLKITIGTEEFTASTAAGGALADTAANLGGAEIELTNANGDKIKATLADTVTKIGNDKVTAGDAIAADTVGTADPADNAGGNNGAGNGGALVLQIGEDGQAHNQMDVKINDMHVKQLFVGSGVTIQANKTDGADTISISTQGDAQVALDAIRTAVNTVSTQRAKLGAIQNRLEHTINNLDVASENMNSANSRVRDTDMAKQMMSYTQMNVLTQAAQAMLAQANQQPQSVLQLLQ
ncbi:MAG: hypothetical protein HFG26_00005, partial [Provencibacterium sp.]|nr:hypothetical protein [Provencibacterium sp.]